tara:strand:- start:1091 stop:1942 length:852 start_codon:yes stop_codon:yes gene_type:complete
LEETLSDIRRAFGDSLRQIEDLRKIGGAPIAPLANQIQYHLTSMLDLAVSKDPLPAQYKNLTKIFKQQIIEKLNRAFPVGENVQRVSSYFDLTANFQTWDRALNHLEGLCQIANSFLPKRVDFRLENDGIVLLLEPSENANAQSCRKKAYQMTQALFEQKAILSYQVTENNNSAQIELRIRNSILETKDLSFCVGDLNFDPIFSNYVSDINSLASLGEHHIVKIDKNSKVSLQNSISEQDSLNATILHLPFLFRPLSIIIFGEGKLQATHAKNSRVELFELFK